VMAGMIVLLAAMPETTPVIVLCLLMASVGAGIALVHPHGLRGTQHIGRIASSISVPAFMTGGFLGSAVGPWVSALLVGSFGLKGLYWMALPVLAVILALRLSNVKLAPDRHAPSSDRSPAGKNAPAAPGEDCPWNFRSLCLIATLLNTGTLTIQALLPSYLVTLDFTLSFGGFSAMLFGAGSAAGSIAIGFLVRKYRNAPFVLGGLVPGIPVVLLYFLFAGHPASCLLIMLGGLLASSCYPLLVSMSRRAEGTLPMSARMGIIVGGTWGIAGIALLAIGQIASRIGLAPVMHLSWIFYLLSLIAALLTRNGNARSLPVPGK
jgi:MFS transporter